MIKKIRNNYSLFLAIILISLITLFFLIININTPMMGEDFALSSFSHYYEPISIKEQIYLIINRIMIQASTWNIRIGEQISIIFCSINPIYYYIGNTIISVLYLLLIPIYAFGRKLKLTEKDDLISIVMSFCLIILFQPALGEIFFWRTGSSNYLWAVFILLVFTIPLRLILNNRDIFQNRKLLICLHTLVGFFSGLTNENTVITFIVLYICAIIYRIIKKQKVYLWIWSSLTSLTAGFCVMIFAPSTAIRMKTYKDIFGINNVTIKDYIYRGLNVINRFFTENIWLVNTLLIVFIVYIALNYEKIKVEIKNKELKVYRTASINVILLLASSLSAGALIGSPYVEIRAFFLIDFFMIGCIVYFSIQLINQINKFGRVIIYIVLGVAVIFTIKENIKIYNTYNDYNQFVLKNYDIIEDAKRNNQNSVKILQYKYTNNRILNTREDYLQSNLKHLQKYFEIKVIYSMKDMYSIDEQQLVAKYIEIMNGMDYIDYSQNNNQLEIIGWAAIKDKDSKNNDISILLKSDNKTYKFSANKNKRKDVSQYYNNIYYDDTGFDLKISGLNDKVDAGKYTIGICINNNIDDSNYIMYTEEEINIS